MIITDSTRNKMNTATQTIKTLEIKTSAKFAENHLELFLDLDRLRMLVPLFVEFDMLPMQRCRFGGMTAICRDWSKADWLNIIDKNFYTLDDFKKCNVLYNHFIKSKNIRTIDLERSKVVLAQKKNTSNWRSVSIDEVLRYVKESNFLRITDFPNDFQYFYFKALSTNERERIIKLLNIKRKKEGLKKIGTWLTDDDVIERVIKNKIKNITECHHSDHLVYRVLIQKNARANRLRNILIEMDVWSETDCIPKSKAFDICIESEKYYQLVVELGIENGLSRVCKHIWQRFQRRKVQKFIAAYIHFKMGYFGKGRMDYIYQWSKKDVTKFLEIYSESDFVNNSYDIKHFALDKGVNI